MTFIFILYCISSIIAMIATISYACYTREQFYPIMLFLVTSKFSFLISGNMIIVITLLFGNILKKIFFGKLRDTEIELLIERSKYSIMETCLALTIFRHELSLFVLLLFGFLLFIKVFHWLGRSRIDYIEQVVPVPLSSHIRIQLLMLTLICIDIFISYKCIHSTIYIGKSVLILFGFEFIVLSINAINCSIRYIMLVIDSFYENGMHYKGLYIMILDIICDGLRFTIYIAFFSLISAHYGLPIHIMREVWMSFVVFQERVSSLLRYLRLTRKLDERLPNATQEEITNAGNCLICREGMTSGKKLACSHVFHVDCLRMWLQHQQSCPLCRVEIQDIPPLPQPQQPDLAVNNQDQQPPNHAPQQNANNNNNNNNNNNMNLIQDRDIGNIQLRQLAEMLHNGDRDTTATNQYTADSNIDPDIPGFFLVQIDNYPAYMRPKTDSTVVSNYKKNTVIFCTTRLRAANGDAWLRAPDGWIIESNEAETCLIQYDLLDIHKSKIYKTNPNEQNVNYPKKINSNKINKQKIVSLQKQVESMSVAISQIQESLALTQCLVSKLLQDDDDDDELHNISVSGAEFDDNLKLKSQSNNFNIEQSILQPGDNYVMSNTGDPTAAQADVSESSQNSEKIPLRELRDTFYTRKSVGKKNEDNQLEQTT